MGEKGDRGGIEEIREIGDGDGQKGDFYGQYLRLCLAGYLRPEKKFDSFPALVQQITADVASTRKICAEATGENLGLGGGNALADTYPFMMRYLSAPLRGKGVQKTQVSPNDLCCILFILLNVICYMLYIILYSILYYILCCIVLLCYLHAIEAEVQCPQ
jgi:hypothetical protein